MSESNIIIKEKDSGVPIFQVKDEKKAIQFSKTPKDPVLEEIKQVPGLYMIHNVLTDEECKQFIDITEEMGYDQALISTSTKMILMSDLRSNKRIIWDLDRNSTIISTIYKRIEKLLPQEIIVKHEKWVPIELNERLRFYRYTGKEVFSWHYDGCYPRNNEEVSFITFLIYLNDNFSGGETNFKVEGKEYPLRPKKGSVSIFFHGNHKQSPLHQGNQCTKGTKYVLRSDVMFKKV